MVSLDITTTPPGARVYLDNVDTLQITPVIFDLLEGQHSYLLRLDGYVDISGTQDIAAGNYYKLDAVMQSTTVAMQQKFNEDLMALGYLGIAVTVGLTVMSWIFSKPAKKSQ